MFPFFFLNAFRRVETPVIRVFKASFFAILFLDLFYVAIGIALTFDALAASARGYGARDVQVRLILTIVMTERFENARLGDDAVSVEGLFVEKRGLVTKRVTFGRKDGGGRCYKKIDEKEEDRKEDERRLL